MDVSLRLLPHQKRLLKSVAKKSLLLCGRGAGKSYVMAAMALLYLLQGKSVLVGGPRYETTRDTLWTEIKKMAFDWGLSTIIKWKESPMQASYGNAHIYVGTYDAPDSTRGYTGISLMLLDEMFLAPLNILSIWGPCMRGPEVSNPRIVGATTPRKESLWNVLVSDPSFDWEIIRASTRDNTFITDEQFELMVSNITSDEMRRQELEGEIIVGSLDSAIIKLSDFPTSYTESSDTRVIAGLDCADGVERDSTSFFARRGNLVLDMWESSSISHEETAQRIRLFNEETPITFLNMDRAFSDYEYNILKYEISCNQVQFGSSASEANRDIYANIRAEMYFNLAKQVKNGLFIPHSEMGSALKRQLTSIGWMKNSYGRLLLTKKEDLRVMIGRSPDIADAAALTCLDYFSDDPVMAAVQSANTAELRRKARAMMG